MNCSQAKSDSAALARAIVGYATEKKAEDTLAMDLSQLLFITDYFVICSAETDRQVKSIAEHVRKEMRAIGERPDWSDGESQGTWVVQDYGDVILHVFRTEERAIYGLERLWKDAPLLPLSGDDPSAEHLPSDRGDDDRRDPQSAES